MTRENKIVTADALAKSMGKRLIGRHVVTEAIGDYPGGIARAVELYPDPAAPEIVFNVKHPSFGICGVFSDETVRLVRQPVALEFGGDPMTTHPPCIDGERCDPVEGGWLFDRGWECYRCGLYKQRLRHDHDGDRFLRCAVCHKAWPNAWQEIGT